MPLRELRDAPLWRVRHNDHNADEGDGGEDADEGDGGEDAGGSTENDE